MNKIVVSDNIKIKNMIYEIRGKNVMLDSEDVYKRQVHKKIFFPVWEKR